MMISITNVVLLAVPEAVLSHKDAKSRSAGKFQPCTVLLLAIPEAVLSRKQGKSVPPGPNIARPGGTRCSRLEVKDYGAGA